MLEKDPSVLVKAPAEFGCLGSVWCAFGCVLATFGSALASGFDGVLFLTHPNNAIAATITNVI